MAIYHFNVRTDSHIAETTSANHANHTEVRIELARFVGELLKEHADQIWTDENWQVDVTDDAGLILYVMRIDAAKTPATLGNGVAGQ